MTVTTTEPAVTETGGVLNHTVCCDQDKAICGHDVTGHPWTTTGPYCPTCDWMDQLDIPCSPTCRNATWSYS